MENNEISRRSEIGLKRLGSCELCPHGCGVDRTREEKGKCGIGRLAEICSYGLHWGEESVLVGNRGSGTVFFAGCNLRCVFCQNEELSHPELAVSHGQKVTDSHLADVFIELQEQGAVNINLVTPSHVVPQILGALAMAMEHGLQVPIIYNTSGYDSVATLRLLEGVVDIYMPDCKFMSRESAARYTNAPDYPRVLRSALQEMHRQVGDLVLDEDGVARRGLLARHLVMPGGLDAAREVCAYLAREISRETYVNLMDQYRPCFRAADFPEISRPLSTGEYAAALRAANDAGLHRIDQRDRRGGVDRLPGQ